MERKVRLGGNGNTRQSKRHSHLLVFDRFLQNLYLRTPVLSLLPVWDGAEEWLYGFSVQLRLLYGLWAFFSFVMYVIDGPDGQTLSTQVLIRTVVVVGIWDES